jgi:hypothetical protein
MWVEIIKGGEQWHSFPNSSFPSYWRPPVRYSCLGDLLMGTVLNVEQACKQAFCGVILEQIYGDFVQDYYC